MKVKIYGARGSTPGQPSGSSEYGAHTTSIRILSDCIPADYALAVDAGSGFTQLSRDAMQEGKKNMALLMTHYHHDHTQGVFLAPHTFAAETFRVWGPEDPKTQVGAKYVFQRLIDPPLFPIRFSTIGGRFKFKGFKSPHFHVFVIHPSAGFHILLKETYEKILDEENPVVVLSRGKFNLNECLVVSMCRTVHPQVTFSYRFEEKPTGKVFVFLTDHEVTSQISTELWRHVFGADLLIQDAQYLASDYPKFKGFGHGTAEYCAKIAYSCGVPELGLTHHDPVRTDTEIQAQVEQAYMYMEFLKVSPVFLMRYQKQHVFACKEGDEIEV